MRHLVAAHANSDRHWPQDHEQAVFWEWTNLLRAARDFGYLTEKSEVLIWDKGLELLAHHLSDYVGRVVCVHPLVEAPQRGTPSRPDRIQVETEAQIAGRKFDLILGVGCLSTKGSVKLAKEEIRKLATMLKPSGALGITADVLQRGKGNHYHDGRLFFLPETLCSEIIPASGLIPVDDPNFAIDDETTSVAYSLHDAVIFGIRPRSVALTINDDVLWTSATLFLRPVAGARTN